MLEKRTYRVVVLGDPRGPWRGNRATAMQDAIDMKLASWDASRREWYLAVPVDIEIRRERTQPADR